MKKEIVFATNNEHKLQEVARILGDEFRVLSLADIGCNDDIAETAPTLEGNALIKARFVYEKYGKNCFSDDTGLEVEALHGAPGVYSARYAGEEKNPEANMNKLLAELQGETNRHAHFRTVIALMIDNEEHLFEGEVRGSILEEKRGNEGFGYDPIFCPEGYDRSFAELSADEKNSISHRARAVEKMCRFLKEMKK
ncbi:MAG: non-canonical purine NTP diphosphatase [Prevotellaceae bacterium]|jgi:XTP/dITP diphosphohydrolase|nr:non-canonical purine NTP diphosphatase [Prevotellaceae bacterium]